MSRVSYSGRLELRNKGTFFRPVNELWVNGRRRETLVVGVRNQALAVEKVLSSLHPGIHVRPALCFIETEWELFASPFEHEEVVVTWPKKLYEMLAKPGPLDAAQIESVHISLSRLLRPAVKS